MKSFYGFKKDQTQMFDENGLRLVVTKIKVEPLPILGFRTKEKDGYQAVKVGIGKAKRLNKPMIGALKGLKDKPRFIREIKTDKVSDLKIGENLKVGAVIKKGDLVKVRGTTKGKGFAGVIKRWGFAGGPRTHGQSDRQRSPGSIGQGTDPGRVWKGKKMPGHMGNKIHTILNLKAVKIDEEENELWLTGLIPGPKGGLVRISRIDKAKAKGEEK